MTRTRSDIDPGLPRPAYWKRWLLAGLPSAEPKLT